MPPRSVRTTLGPLTERGLGLSGAGIVLWVAARTFGIPELQMAAVGVFALLVLALSFLLLGSTRLRVERLVRPGRLFHDATGEVELTVTNTSRLPTATLALRDRVPATLSSQTTTVVGPLRGGARTTVRYPVRGLQRGRFDVGPLTVSLRDPFGVVARRRVIGDPATLTVYPPVWRLPDGVPIGGATSSGGEGRPRPQPSGEDLANVREYVRGDDLRTVHWASTAHRGKLMVRQAESPQDPRVVLLLDVRRARHRGQGPSSSFETAVSAAASITYHVSARGRQVALVDRPLLAGPLVLPWQQWLERLADAEPDEVDLTALLQQVARGTAGDGTLVVVSTVPEPAELRLLVRAGRGFSTRIAVLVDAASHAGRPDVEVARAVAASAAALRAAGWRVTVVAAGDRFDDRWQELLRRPRLGAGA
ncbi:DUF58 domain-containing protein [Egicoccus halophilus]|uniref:DUF58 domain-containing protein n=1 Tax=Egicoccus halophilus TaxID=1670830 RepID=A0A8J3EWS4_9ACTN|nr:DUF58 domain-containing protein [Egicoccus halophilus]GGI04303.1 hypothetical protein GCM10011354_08420 [Egicoccus halophilus]